MAFNSPKIKLEKKTTVRFCSCPLLSFCASCFSHHPKNAPEKQLNHCGFATARIAHQGHLLSLADAQVHFPQDQGFGAMGVVEPDLRDAVNSSKHHINLIENGINCHKMGTNHGRTLYRSTRNSIELGTENMP